MELLEAPISQRHKDVYRAFYTTDAHLVDYMVDLLAPEDGESCLEPAAGSGCFIDGLLNKSKSLRVTGLDLSATAIQTLQKKYDGLSNVDVREQDFIAGEVGLFDTTGTFDRVIGNPPYGGWQTLSKRALLKTRYPGLYVRETYGIFLAQSLSKLRVDGRLVFIIPETFLYLHLQKGLRKMLLDGYSIQSIDVFPSSVFPGVRFGYAKLCIISIDKRVPDESHQFTIRQSQSLEELVGQGGRSVQILQQSLLLRADFAFPLHGYNAEASLVDNAEIRMVDVADCVTGIYSGNDQAFLYRSFENPRGAAKYRIADASSVHTAEIGDERMHGLSGERILVPVSKGGGERYVKSPHWFLDWSREAVKHYRTDKKARFQNSGFYFRRGIGFPMVTSSRVSASVIHEHWLFDQSIVGVFPKHPKHFGFLLAFLNSEVCWKLLRQINPSANSSSKYLKKLPIILPEASKLQWFTEVVEGYITKLAAGSNRDLELEQELEQEVRKTYASARL